MLLQVVASCLVTLYLYWRRGVHALAGTHLRVLWTVLAGLSLANLALLHIWSELFAYARWAEYEMWRPPSSGQIWAALVDMALLSAVFVPVLHLTRRNNYHSTAMCRVILFSALLPLNALREVIGTRYLHLLKFGFLRQYGATA